MSVADALIIGALGWLLAAAVSVALILALGVHRLVLAASIGVACGVLGPLVVRRLLA